MVDHIIQYNTCTCNHSASLSGGSEGGNFHILRTAGHTQHLALSSSANFAFSSYD